MATARHSATAVVVSNFTLPAPPLDVLERCLLRGRGDAYSLAVQAEGDTVEAMQPWRAVGADGLLGDGEADLDLDLAANWSSSTSTSTSGSGSGSGSGSASGSLWARTLTYTHHRAGGLLMGPSSSLHALHQLLLVVVASEEPGGRKASKAPPASLSVLLAGSMDLSHVPYCQGCSYTTLLTLRPETDGDKNVTRVTVTLDTTKGPSTLYQSLVVGGIKGGVVSLMEAWQRSARACLGAGSDDQSPQALPPLPAAQRVVRGEGEQQLLRRLGRGAGSVLLVPSEGLSLSASAEDAYPDPADRPPTPVQEAAEEATQNNHNNHNHHPFWPFGRSAAAPPRSAEHEVEGPELQLSRQWERQRAHWRRSKAVVVALQRAPPAFTDHLASIGLIRRRRTGLLGLLRLRLLLSAAFWSGVTLAAVEASKRSSDIAWAAEVAKRNARDFIQVWYGRLLYGRIMYAHSDLWPLA
jgi:hypothetical protein